MKSTDKLMDMLCNEIDELSRKDKLSAPELDTLHKLVLTKEKLLRIDEIEQNMGYSQDSGMRNGYQRNSYSDRGRYSNTNSYGYPMRGRYSMSDGNGMMMDSMQAMMNDPAMSEADKEAIRRTMYMMGR